MRAIRRAGRAKVQGQCSLASDALVKMAEALSPGMANVLERLAAGYLTGTRPQFNQADHSLLLCAAVALATVNRTPNAAAAIGRHAAEELNKRTPEAANLLQLSKLRRIA